MDDNLSADVVALCKFSGLNGRHELSFETLTSMPNDSAAQGTFGAGSSSAFRLYELGAGLRMGVTSGHCFNSLQVPHSLRCEVSPAPAGAGEEVALHDLPGAVLLTIVSPRNYAEFHHGVFPDDNGSATYYLAACSLSAPAPEWAAADADALVWICTLSAARQGIRFFRSAIPSAGGEYFVSCGNRGIFPAATIARTDMGARHCRARAPPASFPKPRKGVPSWKRRR